MVATASSAAADISSHVESVHPQFSATTEPNHNSVGVAERILGSDGSTGRCSDSPTSEEHCEDHGPMDLSSGGSALGAERQAMLAATPTFMQAMAAAAVASNNSTTPTSLADSLLNARRLAEFVRAQQLRHEEAENATPKINSSPPPMVPRKRAWPELQLDLSAMMSEKLKKKNNQNEQQSNQIQEPHRDNQNTSGGPTSPGTESNSSGGGTATPTNSNKEVKKRRLDQLLSKKFSFNDSPPPPSLPLPTHMNNIATPTHEINHMSATPPINEGVATAIRQHIMRRDSSEKKQNRRKRSSPQSSIHPPSPVTLSLRPNSELFNQIQQHPKSEIAELPIEKSLPQIADLPNIPENQNPIHNNHNNVAENQNNGGSKNGNSNLKNQLLQMHLAQAALMNQTSSNLFPGLPGLPGLPLPNGVPAAPVPNPANPGANPLLYYGYYAQMIQGLQSQQQKLLEQLTGKSAAKNILTSSPISTKPKNELLPSPFQTPKSHGAFSPSRILPATPHSPPSPKYRDEHNGSPHNLLSSPLSVGGADEPRRRAPRALTGRYVKSGPGASPRVLAILRTKIEERLKLKELLGENSHLYFGALKQQKMKPKNVANLSRPTMGPF